MRLASRHSERRPGLGQYLERRLGRDSAAMLRNWGVRSFGAPTLGEFWQYWNPVYGYVLAYYVYCPLRRRLPRGWAVWLPFVACGFGLHDLVGWVLTRKVRVPEMTLLFVVFGAEVVLTERLHFDLSGRPLLVRVVANCVWLLGAFGLVHLMVSPAGP
jgi:hypothetical protein